MLSGCIPYALVTSPQSDCPTKNSTKFPRNGVEPRRTKLRGHRSRFTPAAIRRSTLCSTYALARKRPRRIEIRRRYLAYGMRTVSQVLSTHPLCHSPNSRHCLSLGGIKLRSDVDFRREPEMNRRRQTASSGKIVPDSFRTAKTADLDRAVPSALIDSKNCTVVEDAIRGWIVPALVRRFLAGCVPESCESGVPMQRPPSLITEFSAMKKKTNFRMPYAGGRRNRSARQL